MGKKARLKAIKNLAANIPLINESTHENHLVLGSEILEWGTITEIDGKLIDPEKKYMYQFPVNIVQNNRRRMKRAYLKNGEAGIRHYLQQTLEIAKSNTTQKP